MGLSLSLERGHEGRIHEVLQKDGCSSMYSNYYMFNIFVMSCILVICRNFLCAGNPIRNTDWCLFFPRLKKKPWLPWVYTWIWHRRKQPLQLLLETFCIWLCQHWPPPPLEANRPPIVIWALAAGLRRCSGWSYRKLWLCPVSSDSWCLSEWNSIPASVSCVALSRPQW